MPPRRRRPLPLALRIALLALAVAILPWGAHAGGGAPWQYPTPPSPPEALYWPTDSIAVEAARVGTLPGAGKVSPTGEYAYELPIDLPEGRAGMTPALAIAYASRGGDSTLGVGFRLKGFSQIDRCAKTFATEGRADGVDLDETDAFCLDGQKLVVVSGAYGGDGAEYRTEQDTFARILSYADPKTHEVTSFRVHRKDGRILDYKAIRLQALKHDGKSVSFERSFTWLLDKEQDRAGNAVHYSYEVNTTPSKGDLFSARVSYYPTQIDYTFQEQTGEAGQRSVTLVYEDRPDKLIAYSNGVEIRTDKRLKSVWVEAPNPFAKAVVWSYHLTYAASPGSGRSLLTEVRRCGFQGGCLAAKQFKWHTAEELDYAQAYALPYPDRDSEILAVADIDGNGKDELITSSAHGPYVRTTGDPAYPLIKREVLKDDGAFVAAAQKGNIKAVDLDGDGALELIGHLDDGYYAYRWDKATQQLIESEAPVATAAHPLSFSDAPSFVDLDGDALADLVRAERSAAGGAPWSWSYQLHQGGAFGPKQGIPLHGAPVLLPGNDLSWSSALSLASDPRGALLLTTAIYAPDGEPYLTGPRLRDDGTLGLVGWDSTPPSFTTPLHADINGDGLEDLVELHGGNDPRLCARLGQGERPDLYTGSDVAWMDFEWAFPCVPLGFYDPFQRVAAADMDGDGRTDIVVMSEPPNGASSMTVVRLDAQNALVAKEFPGIGMGKLGDFDGDGRLEVAWWDQSLFHVAKPRGAPGRDVLEKIFDEDNTQAREEVVYADQWSPAPEASICAYPQRCIRHGLPVVRKHRVAAGGGRVRARYFSYEDPRYDLRGRGFLGFGVARVWDPNVPEETITTFDHASSLGGTYGFALRPKSVRKVVPIVEQYWEPTGPALPRTAVARVVEIEMQDALDRLNQDKTYFVHPWQWSSREWEEEVSIAWDAGAKEHVGKLDGPAQGALRERSGSMSFDAYGNVRTQKISTKGGVTTEVISTYDNLVGPWLLGLERTRTTTSFVPGATSAPKPRRLEYEYDDRGFVFAVYIERSNPDPSLRLTTFLHRDSEGLLQGVEAVAPGEPTRRTYFAYDKSERVYTTQRWNDLGHGTWTLPSVFGPVVTMDANGVETRFQYDDAGRLHRIVPEGAGAVTVTYEPRLGFDGVTGMIEDVATEAGGERRTTYDDLGRVVERARLGFDGKWITEQNAYDLTGRLIAEEQVGTAAVTHHRYDSLGRPLGDVLPDQTSIVRAHTFFRTTTLDAKKNPSYVERDVDGRVIKSVQILDGKELATSFAYGDFDQLTRVTDQAQNVTEIKHDARGRLTSRLDADTGYTSFGYNGFGEQTVKITNGAITTYQHDQAGRITRSDSADGTTFSTWDTSPHGIGKLHETISPDGTIEDFAYDDSGRLTQQTWTVEGEAFTVDLGYDSVGNIETVAYPAVAGMPRFTAYHVLDTSGHLAAVADISSGFDVLFQVDSRDARDALTHGTYGNGVTTDRTYDPLTGRLKTIQDGAVYDLTYGYDLNGMVTSRDDGVRGRHEIFDLDDLQRLTGWHLSQTQAPKESAARDTNYQYDDLGNLTKVFLNGSFVAVEDNIYGQNGKPHTLTSNLGGSYHYDPRGRMDTSPSQQVLYTDFDLPRTIISGAGVTTFSYDAAGARVKKAGPAGTTITLGGLYERRQDAAGTKHIFYVHGSDGPVAQVVYEGGTAKRYYLHLDAQGSVGLVTDDSGAEVDRFYYEPFGKRITEQGGPILSGGPKNGLGFTGQHHDDELGLIDLHGRVYDPALRRFLTPDPHVTAPLFGQNYNPYSYALNNPVNLTDPSGFDWWDGGGGGGCIGLECYGGGGWAGQMGDPGAWREDVNWYVPQPSRSGGDSSSRPIGSRSVVGSDTQRVTLPTGSMASSAPNLSTADKIGGFSVGVVKGYIGMALSAARNMCTPPPVLAYEHAAAAVQGFQQGYAADGLVGGIAGAVNTVNPLYGLGRAGVDTAMALEREDWIGAGEAAAPIVVTAATLGEGGLVAAEEGVLAATEEGGLAAGRGAAVEAYEVGTFDALRARSVVGDGLDLHHVGQAHVMEQILPGYSRANGPAIALPRAEHALVPAQRGTSSMSPRDLLARDIWNLRNTTNVPNSSLQRLILLNKELYPGAFSK